MKTLRRATLGFVALGLVGLTSCGSDNKSSTATTAAGAVTTAAAGAATTAAGATTTTVAGDPNATINIIVGGGPTQFDPHKFTSTQSDPGYYEPVYDQLLKLDNDGHVAPALAASYTSSPDNMTFTFKLRKANFQDNTPFNAAAVVANLQRAKSLEGSTVARFIPNMTAVTAPSDDTAVVTFSQPYPTFPYVLAANPGLSSMISPAAINNPDLGQKPVGAGGMKLVSFTTTTATFEKWDGYWDAANAYRFKTLNYNGSFNADPNAKLAAVSTGQYDAAFTNPTEEAIYKPMLDKGFALTPNLYQDYGLYINTKSNPAFQNPAVLKALSMAIDRPTINQSITGGQGTPAYQWLYQGTSGYVKALDVNPYSVDAAKKALADAGVSGLSFKIIDPGIQPASRIIQILQQEFSQIGVKMDVEVVAGAAARATYRKGEYGGFSSVILTGPDPSDFVSTAITGPDALGGAPADMVALANTALQTSIADPNRDKAFEAVSQSLAATPISIPVIWVPVFEIANKSLLNVDNKPFSREFGTYQDPRYLQKKSG